MRQTLTKWRKSWRKIKKYFSLSTLQSILSSIPLSKNTYLTQNWISTEIQDWKDKKKYSQKSIDSYFTKNERSSPPPVQCKKSSSAARILKRKKTCWRAKTAEDGGEKKEKTRTYTRNCCSKQRTGKNKKGSKRSEGRERTVGVKCQFRKNERT